MDGMGNDFTTLRIFSVDRIGGSRFSMFFEMAFFSLLVVQYTCPYSFYDV